MGVCVSGCVMCVLGPHSWGPRRSLRKKGMLCDEQMLDENRFYWAVTRVSRRLYWFLEGWEEPGYECVSTRMMWNRMLWKQYQSFANLHLQPYQPFANVTFDTTPNVRYTTFDTISNA